MVGQDLRCCASVCCTPSNPRRWTEALHTPACILSAPALQCKEAQCKEAQCKETACCFGTSPWPQASTWPKKPSGAGARSIHQVSPAPLPEKSIQDGCRQTGCTGSGFCSLIQ